MTLLADPATPTAVRLCAALRSREVSAREVLAEHLARVEQVNPQVNAVVTQVAEQAWEQAAAADQHAVRAAREGAELPLLHGLPMTHKDTHATRGVRTTMGSPLLAEAVPEHDDLIISRLVLAGAITTGKNNVPEFAAGSHTFNPVFGATRNPHDLARSAGGSSGGAAVAVATGIQALADGSDMGGSLRNPAAFCGVVGMRPSPGVVPAVPTLDPHAWLATPGPVARTVEDVLLMLAAVAGPDPRTSLPCPATAADFARLFAAPVAADLAGLRVGVSTDLGIGLPVEAEAAAGVERAARVLEGLGAHVERDCPRLGAADLVFDTTRALAMALGLRAMIAGHQDDGLVKEEVLWNVERGLALTGADVVDAAVARGELDQEVRRWFERFDLLLAPTTQVLPFPVEERWPRVVAGEQMETYVEWMRSCSVISATGCPAVSLPAGSVGALPVGVQLIGAPGRDVELLTVARVVHEWLV